MDGRSPGFMHAPNSPTPLFVAQRPDHVPPEALGDADLATSIESLRRKRHVARRALLVTRVIGAAATMLIVTVTLLLLWAGPAAFFERFLGRGAVTTTYDAMAWWIVVVLLAIGGVLSGDRSIRGKLKVVRRWHHRVSELTRRLGEAEAVLAQRRGKRAS